MQPTKKRSVVERGLTTTMLLLLSTGPAKAEPYTQSPKTMYGDKVETQLTTKVSSIIAATHVVWSPAAAVTSQRPTHLGDLRIVASGDGVKPAAYLITPCGNLDYDVKINGANTPVHLRIESADYDARGEILTATSDPQSSALLKIYADTAPLAGEYTSCVAVTSMADEPERESE
ncbi:hypothetical protein PV619_001204 [Salmonella enterica]|nr:hypothetical protein [Salmonella enterica]